jgi:hypothetical protein
MEAWFKELLPKVLPSAYQNLGSFGPEGWMFKGRDFRGSFTVIIDWALYGDGRKWIHLSVARPDKMPEWSLLREVKNLFIGRERQAIQVLPNESKYVNIHPYCLHLFACVEGDDPMPDFTRGMGGL